MTVAPFGRVGQTDVGFAGRGDAYRCCLCGATCRHKQGFNNFELVSALVAKDVLKVNRIVKYFNDNPKNFSLQLTLSVMFGFSAI